MRSAPHASSLGEPQDNQRVGPLRAGVANMDWGFIVFFGTLLFFAALHQWPPDGKRWQREEITIREQEQAQRRREGRVR